MKKILLFIYLAFALSHALAQKPITGSLRQMILSLETDSTIAIPDIMANPNIANYPDSSIYYARQLIAYGRQHHNQRIISQGFNIVSYGLYNKGNYPAALNMAFQSLRATESGKETLSFFSTYNLIGNIYKGQQNFSKALFYYRRARQLAYTSHNMLTLNAVFLNMAFVFNEVGVLDSALYYSKIAAYNSEKNLHSVYLGYILGTMGDVYFKLKNYKKALELYLRAYSIGKKTADFRDAGMNGIRLAKYYNQTGKPDSGFYYLYEGLKAAKKASYNKSVFEGTELLARMYEAKHQPDSAFKYLKLASAVKDSLYNAAKSGELENLTTDEFVRQNEIQAAEAAYHARLRIYALIFTVLVFAIAGFLQLRNSLQRKRAYVLLQKQNAEIEAQKAEARVEVALERVRSRTMAMQHSDELPETSALLFQQVKELGETAIQNSIAIVNEETGFVELSTTVHGSHLLHTLNVPVDDPFLMAKAAAAWKAKQKSLTVRFEGQELKDYNELRNSFLETKINFPEDQWIVHISFFSKGWLSFSFDKNIPGEIIDAQKRFAAVFDQTYTRFLDLQRAEIQTREAVKQASLDRVRGEIASMRSTNDLVRITPLIWNELTILGVPFIRCGVFIMDEQHLQINSYLSTPDGKAIAAFQLHFSDDAGNGVTGAALQGWRQKQAVTLHWTEEEFRKFSHSLVEQGELATEEGYLTEHLPTGLDLHFFPFLQGMLYAGNSGALSDNEKDLVQSLADAFSTAYARYEDFNKLDLAKQQVENTLADLKAAQTQLIQNEKMASLGELTAGIAHEIQNPLNFVNNFSEVNREMIDELEDELKAGNIEDALALIADIKQNEEKIHHHGKRADSIVKGMLQHSRTSGGDKQATNINALADEFMRLSYHGLRAKDKSFNAEMITHFDTDLPKIEVVGQDIGRVILNLFNNAFYAVNQKAKTAGPKYKPEVSCETFFLPVQGVGGFRVRDNGNGIQDAIKDKIMQPFFTTKPTGEGTGLGLSLSYDIIVKGHGGGIQLNTKENEFTEFVVSLPLT